MAHISFEIRGNLLETLTFQGKTPSHFLQKSVSLLMLINHSYEIRLAKTKIECLRGSQPGFGIINRLETLEEMRVGKATTLALTQSSMVGGEEFTKTLEMLAVDSVR